jgi:nitrite reductase/ring-hydroxylating ferredoxin subunit
MTQSTFGTTSDNRAQFLKSPLDAYHHREVPPEDEELTHVGPGSPGGEYLRRFWQPIVFLEELKDVPLAIMVLGEELVVYKDKSDNVGCLELHCPHRGTSLEFAIVEERGVRCCYHGWKIDADGTILETPGEPSGSTLRERLFQGAYPVRVYGGLVFVYMGPPDKIPGFPELDTWQMPNTRLVPRGPILRNVLPCNWLQIKENCMDPVHTAFLHTLVSGIQFTEAYAEIGVQEWQESPTGMVYIHTRRKEDMVWVHMAEFIAPNIHQIPATWENASVEKSFARPMATMWAVPIDDTHTMTLGLFIWRDDMDPTVLERANTSFGLDGSRSYDERQRRPGDYDAQVSQRPIDIHGLEHLGTTDRGVIMLRKIVRDGIGAVQHGANPKGLLKHDTANIQTYTQDTVISIPPKLSAEEDAELLREQGREVAELGFAERPTMSRG